MSDTALMNLQVIARDWTITWSCETRASIYAPWRSSKLSLQLAIV